MGENPVVVLVDGGCLLCHRAVALLHMLDRKGVLAYAPLDAAWMQRYPKGVVVLCPQGISVGADAVVCALRYLGPVGGVLSWVVRNIPGYKKIYRWVAAHRYQIFGRTKEDLTSCRAPSSWHGRRPRFLQTPPLPEH